MRSRRACFGKLAWEDTRQPATLKQLVEEWPPAFARSMKDLARAARCPLDVDNIGAYCVPVTEQDFDRLVRFEPESRWLNHSDASPP